MNEDQPSLLQMAQQQPQPIGSPGGISLADLAASYGPEWLSNPALNSGAPYRPITSPEDQNWNDLQGNPIHMGGPAPAYQSGTTFGGYNSIFDPRAPSRDGGWFTMEDYLNQAPTAMEAAMNPGSQAAPIRQGRETGLSTNNWRLLGNDPDLFMMNGQMISRRKIRDQLAPKSILGLEGGHGVNSLAPSGGGGMFINHAGGKGYVGTDNFPLWTTLPT